MNKNKNKNKNRVSYTKQTDQRDKILTMSLSLRIPVRTLATLILYLRSRGAHPTSRSEALLAMLHALTLDPEVSKHAPLTDEESLNVVQELIRGANVAPSKLRVSRAGIEKLLDQSFSRQLVGSTTGSSAGQAPGAFPGHTPDLVELAAQLEEPDAEDFSLNGQGD